MLLLFSLRQRTVTDIQWRYEYCMCLVLERLKMCLAVRQPGIQLASEYPAIIQMLKQNGSNIAKNTQSYRSTKLKNLNASIVHLVTVFGCLSVGIKKSNSEIRGHER